MKQKAEKSFSHKKSAESFLADVNWHLLNGMCITLLSQPWYLAHPQSPAWGIAMSSMGLQSSFSRVLNILVCPLCVHQRVSHHVSLILDTRL